MHTRVLVVGASIDLRAARGLRRPTARLHGETGQGLHVRADAGVRTSSMISPQSSLETTKRIVVDAPPFRKAFDTWPADSRTAHAERDSSPLRRHVNRPGSDCSASITR